jgi:hypothetical protein
VPSNHPNCMQTILSITDIDRIFIRLRSHYHNRELD